MNTNPLKNYIDARDALNAGDEETALKLMAKSVGATTPTPLMRDALGILTDKNEAALTLVLHESKKEEADSDG